MLHIISTSLLGAIRTEDGGFWCSDLVSRWWIGLQYTTDRDSSVSIGLGPGTVYQSNQDEEAGRRLV